MLPCRGGNVSLQQPDAARTGRTPPGLFRPPCESNVARTGSQTKGAVTLDGQHPLPRRAFSFDKTAPFFLYFSPFLYFNFFYFGVQ